MPERKRHTFVTLVATDSYASGALVLARALREHGTTKEIACLVTSTISEEVQHELAQVFDLLHEVQELNTQSYENLRLLGRLDLGVTLTKIHLWKLTQFDKVVFLDADTLPLRNVDELFLRPEFAAAPDSGWPDCFNSGVFVAKPNIETYEGMYKLARETGSFDGGDQGLLNTYFSDWSEQGPAHRLPFTYNTTPTAVYSYRPAFKEFQGKISIIHFIGANKPWHWTKFSDGSLFPMGNASPGLVDLVQKWWNVWEKYYGNTSPIRTSQYEIPTTSSNPQAVHFSASRYNSDWGAKGDIVNSISDVPAASMPPLFANGSRSVDVESGWSAPHDISVMVDAPPVVEHHYQAPAPPPQPAHHDTGHGSIHWNPAYEGPPDRNPVVTGIPSFARYSNAWDRPFQRGGAFVPQMSPSIQMQRIFPWEQANYIPSRIWLDEEAERKEKEEIQRKEYEAALAAQGRRDSGYNEPGRDEQRFVNVWDSMPSVSKYVARLRGEVDAERKATAIATANMRTEIANQRDSYAPECRFMTAPTSGTNVLGGYGAFSRQGKETKASPSALFGRTKSQMFANHPKTGPTPYTSAATTPNAEYPPLLDNELEDIVPPGQRSPGHPNDLDINPVGWASDLQRVPQSDDIVAAAKIVNRPRAGFDVTPSISPPQGSPLAAVNSRRVHHFRAPSGRSDWNPDEALHGVRHASLVFGGLEGGEAAKDEEERLSSYYHDEENEDLEVLGMRVDRSQEEGNDVLLTGKELVEATGGVEDKLDPRQGSLFLRRASREGPFSVDQYAAPSTASASTHSVLDKLKFIPSVSDGAAAPREAILSGLTKSTEESEKGNTIMGPAEGDAFSAATSLEKETAAIEVLDAGELKARLEEVQHTSTTTTTTTTTEPLSQTLKLTTAAVAGIDTTGKPVIERKLSASSTSPTMYGRPNISRKTSDSGESTRLGRSVSVVGSTTTVRRALSPSITERIEVMYGADAVVPEARSRSRSPRPNESYQCERIVESEEGEWQIDPTSVTTTIFRSSSSGDTFAQVAQDGDEHGGSTVRTLRSGLVLQSSTTTTFTTTIVKTTQVEDTTGHCHVTELELEDNEENVEEDSDSEVEYENRISFESLDIDEE